MQIKVNDNFIYDFLDKLQNHISIPDEISEDKLAYYDAVLDTLNTLDYDELYSRNCIFSFKDILQENLNNYEPFWVQADDIDLDDLIPEITHYINTIIKVINNYIYLNILKYNPLSKINIYDLLGTIYISADEFIYILINKDLIPVYIKINNFFGESKNVKTFFNQINIKFDIDNCYEKSCINTRSI